MVLGTVSPRYQLPAKRNWGEMGQVDDSQMVRSLLATF